LFGAFIHLEIDVINRRYPGSAGKSVYTEDAEPGYTHGIHIRKKIAFLPFSGPAHISRKEFDVFVTVDRNLSFQQNLTNYNIAIVILRARTNRLRDLRPLVSGGIAHLVIRRKTRQRSWDR
jgi:hypothetical protein